MEKTWQPCWLRGSKIEEIAWISKDVLAWCAGVHIVFFNVAQKRQSLLWCWNHATGEGARCISGHATLPIFAFCERTPNPRILVLSYPSMTRISECKGGSQTGYATTAFASTDKLLSIGLFPHFPLILWNWKTGEKIISVNTSMHDDVAQILRVTRTKPTVVAQMGRSSGKLFTWEMDLAGKVISLKDHEIKLPKDSPIYWVDWCPTSTEPLLAITNRDGHIFLSNTDGSTVQQIVVSQRCGVCEEIEHPLVCWFRGGIILRTTFCQIRFFRQNPETNKWRRVWSVKSVLKPYILVTHPHKNDRFYYHTLDGYLMQITIPKDEKIPSVQRHLHYGAIYKFVDFVHPWCHHLVVTDDSKELTVLECYSGVEVSRIDPETSGDISCQASHPDYPLVALLSTQGELVILSIVDPDEPRVLARLKLQRDPLDLLKFSHSGKFLIAGQRKSGTCYCVNLNRDKIFTVQAQIKPQKRISDVLLYEIRGGLKVLVIQTESKQFSTGQQLLVFDIPQNVYIVTESSETLQLNGVYRSLWHVPGNPQLLIGSAYSARQLRVQRLQDFNDIVPVDGIVSGHHVKQASVFVDRHWITTAALDGLVFVRDKSVKRVVAIFMSHHRQEQGTVKAVANQNADLIVCLGRNGSLVAVKTSRSEKRESSPSTQETENSFRVDYGWYERQKKKIFADYGSLESSVHDLLTRRTLVFPEDRDKTWEEYTAELRLEEEAKLCANEKAAILRDLSVLRTKIRDLLDANEECPDIEKLPVSAFDLDKAGRDHKLKIARDDRENVRQELEHNCNEMERVSSWMKKTFWDPQKVLGKSVFSIDDDKEVANYPLTSVEPEIEENLWFAEFCRESMSRIVGKDVFQPWRNYTDEELRKELKKRVNLHREDERRRMDMLLEETDRDVEQQDPEELRACDGTTTHRFVEPSPYYYSQMESYGFAHVTVNERFLTHDRGKLRLWFNKMFDEVYVTKEREMSAIREKIDRIRHVDSELRNMFNQQVPRVPVDPEWHQRERPGGIIVVLDHEVAARPYVSPSQQEILDKQAAEAERIRRLLLADDFRERALMAMMDGVLEVRWEDVIKIDVPKPRCILDKKPEEYTAEDILMVKQYERDVQALQQERERYRRILEADYLKINGLLLEGIEKFNAKLNELFQLKIKIEAAINQMNLRHVRGCLRNFRRVKALEEEDGMKEKIAEEYRYEAALTDRLQSFRNVQEEFYVQYEGLCNRDKNLSKRFRVEFSALGKLDVEVMEKQYKRRPKLTLKNLGPGDFVDLGQCVLSQSQPVHLPVESREYLKIMDSLDVRPLSLPTTIEDSHWEHLIRLRRLKIDLELRIKSKQAEIAEVEATITIFDDRTKKCRSSLEEMTRRLEETRKDRLTLELDIEVQLVLKMGQVEINMRGDPRDTENAIFVPRAEIEAVNRLIHAAGSCKLDSLKRTVNFHRGTLLKEWEHEILKKRLDDLEEDLRFTRGATVTKEIQAYLKRKARGFRDDKTAQQLNEETTTMRARFEKLVSKQAAKLEDIQKEIALCRRRNCTMDRKIVEMNVERCVLELSRDIIGEERQREYAERKMRMIKGRSDLIKKLQDNYAELLALQTEHELLRLRTYPMLQFKRLDDS